MQSILRRGAAIICSFFGQPISLGGRWTHCTLGGHEGEKERTFSGGFLAGGEAVPTSPCTGPLQLIAELCRPKGMSSSKLPPVPSPSVDALGGCERCTQCTERPCLPAAALTGLTS